ncbi:MAG: AraC family transcriptional regulator [Blastocatellia bacterium]
MQSNGAELVERMALAAPEDGILEVFPGFFLGRSSRPTQKMHSVFKPAFCVIAQGSKQVLLGEEVFRYDPGHYLISTVDLPIVSQVVEASKEQPYFSFRLDLDASLVASVMVESGIEIEKSDAGVKALDVSSIDADMLDAVVRLARLLDTPVERKVLAPLVIREIVCRLLRGEQGARLGHLLASGGDARRISKAIGRLRENFDRPLRSELMTSRANSG